MLLSHRFIFGLRRWWVLRRSSFYLTGPLNNSQGRHGHNRNRKTHYKNKVDINMSQRRIMSTTLIRRPIRCSRIWAKLSDCVAWNTAKQHKTGKKVRTCPSWISSWGKKYSGHWKTPLLSSWRKSNKKWVYQIESMISHIVCFSFWFCICSHLDLSFFICLLS